MAKTTEPVELTPLQLVEQEHGFVFGTTDGDESTNARVVATVNCVNPTCSNRGQFVQLHEDSVLPCHCGSCGSVLLCDHNFDDRDRHPVQTVSAGTFGSPREESFQKCDKCGTQTPKTVKQLEPMRLEDLPFATVQKMIASADDEPGSIRL